MRLKEQTKVVKSIKKEFFASVLDDRIFLLSNSGKEYFVDLNDGIYMFRRLSANEYTKMREADLCDWRIETNGQDAAVVYESDSVASPTIIAGTVIKEIRRIESI